MSKSPLPTQPTPLLSLAALARRLDIPFSKAKLLMTDGFLVPNHVAGPLSLFDPTRVQGLKVQLRELQ